jgi:hypothetical protein
MLKRILRVLNGKHAGIFVLVKRILAKYVIDPAL